MDKASIIKDAIEYIQQLQAEERQVLQEVRLLESAAGVPQAEECYALGDEGLLPLEAAERTKKPKRARSVPPSVAAQPPPPPVEVLELRVSEVGERVLVVSLACSKRRDAMARVCRAIEELRLRVITASITSVAGCLMHTVFVEVPLDSIEIESLLRLTSFFPPCDHRHNLRRSSHGLTMELTLTLTIRLRLSNSAFL